MDSGVSLAGKELEDWGSSQWRCFLWYAEIMYIDYPKSLFPYPAGGDDATLINPCTSLPTPSQCAHR